jgi:HEPN domain-containing protein
LTDLHFLFPRDFKAFEQEVTILPRLVKAKEVYRLIQEGHWFYCKYCTKDGLIYDDRINDLPEAVDQLSFKDQIEKQKELFKTGTLKADQFLEGANYYYHKNQNELSAFMLPQAVELSLRSFHQFITDHNPTTHNLYKLRRLCLSFCPEIKKIFPLDTNQENELFYLLQKAYVKARYSEDFIITDIDLESLLNKSTKLQKLFLNSSYK